jgi:hypothetical protein
MLNVAKEVAAMERMTVGQLRIKYADVFGEPTNGRNKRWLIKRIAWRMQANAEGDLSERARRRAMKLANDADLRMTPPRERKAAPQTEEFSVTAAASATSAMLPGTALKREYKGETIRVMVLADGFEYLGERYKSLSAVAKAVTGQHWNGRLFFGLRKHGGGR